MNPVLQTSNILANVYHGYATNDADDVKIHFATTGSGPLCIMVHGFPDFWYTWRNQMAELASLFKVVAIDLRGYNGSSKPDGVENYTYDHLVSDIVSVIDHFKEQKAILIGHDWGASIGWRVVSMHPDRIEKFVALSVPHPDSSKSARLVSGEDAASFGNVLASAGFEKRVSMDMLTGWIQNRDDLPEYIEAFNKSSITAMLNYYRANYPTTKNLCSETFKKQFQEKLPAIKIPVLAIVGRNDSYCPPSLYNDTWD